MRTRNGWRAPVALFAALLAITATAAACGSDSKDSSTSNTTAAGASTGSSTATGALPDKITIGYQEIPNGDLIVKEQGWLEEALPDTEIEWKLFDSGGSVNEAFQAGSLDFGLAGSSPVSRGVSQGIEYQVPWIHDVIGDAEALVVKSDITSIDDLEGKKIATPFASTAHFSLLAALEDAGVPASDVNIIDAEPADIYAAWTAGDIDGAYVWNPNLASIVADGGKTLITSADLDAKGQTTYDLAVVATTFAAEYPDAVRIWVEQQNKAVELIQDSPDEAADIIGNALNLAADEVLPQLEGLKFLNASEQIASAYLGGGLATNLYDSGVFNEEQGKIDTVADEATYQAAVLATFATEAAKG